MSDKPMTQKEAFEEFVRRELGDVPVMDAGRYISPKINNYWRTWQAATERAAIENAQLVAHIEKIEQWQREGATFFEGRGGMFVLGGWWADRPWRKRPAAIRQSPS